MRKIIVIATVHSSLGLCNQFELLKVLQNIKPKVVFDEISNLGLIRGRRGEIPKCLETEAVELYSKNNPVSHIPVGIDEAKIENIYEFKRLVDEIMDMFNQNIDYQILQDELYTCTEVFGFPYLNSNNCKRLLAIMRTHESNLANSFSETRLKDARIGGSKFTKCVKTR